MGVRAVCRKTVLSVGRRGTDVGSNKINQNFELTLLPISSVSLLGLLKHLEEKWIKAWEISPFHSRHLHAGQVELGGMVRHEKPMFYTAISYRAGIGRRFFTHTQRHLALGKWKKTYNKVASSISFAIGEPKSKRSRKMTAARRMRPPLGFWLETICSNSQTHASRSHKITQG